MYQILPRSVVAREYRHDPDDCQDERDQAQGRCPASSEAQRGCQKGDTDERNQVNEQVPSRTGHRVHALLAARSVPVVDHPEVPGTARTPVALIHVVKSPTELSSPVIPPVVSGGGVLTGGEGLGKSVGSGGVVEGTDVPP